MEAPRTPPEPPTGRTSADDAAGTMSGISSRIRGLSPGLFGVIVLCFFLPFVSVMCTGATLITMKGSDFVFGGTAEVNDDIEKSFEESFDLGPLGEFSDEASGDPATDELPETEDVDPNLFAIVAFGAAVAGVVAGLVFRTSRRDLVLSVLAGLVLLSLLVFRFDIGGDTEGAPVEIKFRYGWWTALLLAAALSVGHFLGHKETQPQRDALRTDHGPPPGP